MKNLCNELSVLLNPLVLVKKKKDGNSLGATKLFLAPVGNKMIEV